MIQSNWLEVVISWRITRHSSTQHPFSGSLDSYIDDVERIKLPCFEFWWRTIWHEGTASSTNILLRCDEASRCLQTSGQGAHPIPDREYRAERTTRWSLSPLDRTYCRSVDKCAIYPWKTPWRYTPTIMPVSWQRRHWGKRSTSNVTRTHSMNTRRRQVAFSCIRRPDFRLVLVVAGRSLGDLTKYEAWRIWKWNNTESSSFPRESHPSAERMDFGSEIETIGDEISRFVSSFSVGYHHSSAQPCSRNGDDTHGQLQRERLSRSTYCLRAQYPVVQFHEQFHRSWVR